MIKDPVERGYFGDKLMLKKGNQKYLNLPLIFPKLQYNTPLKFILKNKNVLVFYEYKHSNSLRRLIFPRYIHLNQEFLVGLGIYLAEGSRNRHPKITNSVPAIINQGIKFFKLFNFTRKDLRAWIQLHERSDKSFKEVKTFWIKNTNLNKKNITNIRTKKASGYAEVEPYGTLHLEINYRLFELLIHNLLKLIPKIIRGLSNEELVWFLQGTYAGDGSVGLAKSGSVNMISYTSTRKGERILIKNILSKFDIMIHENNKSGDLDACGYYNIKKFYDLNIFNYHPYRNLRLKNGLIKLEDSHIPSFNKNRIIELLKKRNYLTTNQIASNLNIKYRNTNKHLNGLKNKNKINKIDDSSQIRHKWFI
ncbi:hypothetical protein HYT58_00140 [Candidatus Woesearchaeota archaeon]|nr:hypothetical protein [Candidatus Woesearchaeota archaeon]